MLAAGDVLGNECHFPYTLQKDTGAWVSYSCQMEDGWKTITNRNIKLLGKFICMTVETEAEGDLWRTDSVIQKLEKSYNNKKESEPKWFSYIKG